MSLDQLSQSLPTPVTSRCEDHVCWLNHQFSMSKITWVNWPPCFNGGRSSSAEQTIGRCRSKERPVGRSGSAQGAEMKHFSGVSQQQTCDLDLSLDQNWAWQACNEQFLPSVKSRVTMTSSKNFPWLTDTSTFPWSLKWGTLITNLQYQWLFEYPWFSNICLPMMVLQDLPLPQLTTPSSGRSKESRKPWSIWQAFRVQGKRNSIIQYPSISMSIFLFLCVYIYIFIYLFIHVCVCAVYV